jgi:triacylglycerol lipase
MRRHSPWLRQLASEEPIDWRGKFTSLYSHCDNIVFPTSTAILSGTASQAIPGTAHVHMVEHPMVFELVMAFLAPTTAPAPGHPAPPPGQPQ